MIPRRVQDAGKRYSVRNEILTSNTAKIMPYDMSIITVVQYRFVSITTLYDFSVSEAVREKELRFMDFYDLMEYQGRLPKERPVYRRWVNAFLDALPEPFIMVSNSVISRYVDSVCEKKRRLNPGSLMISPNTWFLSYAAKDIPFIYEAPRIEDYPGLL